MAITRRQFEQGLWAGFLAHDPLQEVAHIMEKAAEGGWFTSPDIEGSVLDVCYSGRRFTRAFGSTTETDTVFPIASITKPIVATAFMVLTDRMALGLQDRVTTFLPEFTGHAKGEVTIQHLLTHTAGLPDSVPNLHDLQKRQASVNDFFVETCRLPLLFKPGTAMSYSNLGVLVVKEIIERLTGISLRLFLKEEVFQPLSMKATSLGLGGRTVESTAKLQARASGIDPNTSYVRDLGTPWGGVHSTAADLTRFLEYFVSPIGRPLRAETALGMLRNHNEGLNQPWGIGFMLANSHDVYYNVRPTWRRYGWVSLVSDPERLPAFGIGCSPPTFGHYGVSGTLAWADPVRHISLVLLTTKEVAHSRDGVLGTVSDMVSRLN